MAEPSSKIEPVAITQCAIMPELESRYGQAFSEQLMMPYCTKQADSPTQPRFHMIIGSPEWIAEQLPNWCNNKDISAPVLYAAYLWFDFAVLHHDALKMICSESCITHLITTSSYQAQELLGWKEKYAPESQVKISALIPPVMNGMAMPVYRPKPIYRMMDIYGNIYEYKIMDESHRPEYVIATDGHEAELRTIVSAVAALRPMKLTVIIRGKLSDLDKQYIAFSQLADRVYFIEQSAEWLDAVKHVSRWYVSATTPPLWHWTAESLIAHAGLFGIVPMVSHGIGLSYDLPIAFGVRADDLDAASNRIVTTSGDLAATLQRLIPLSDALPWYKIKIFNNIVIGRSWHMFSKGLHQLLTQSQKRHLA